MVGWAGWVRPWAPQGTQGRRYWPSTMAASPRARQTAGRAAGRAAPGAATRGPRDPRSFGPPRPGRGMPIRYAACTPLPTGSGKGRAKPDLCRCRPPATGNRCDMLLPRGPDFAELWHAAISFTGSRPSSRPPPAPPPPSPPIPPPPLTAPRPQPAAGQGAPGAPSVTPGGRRRAPAPAATAPNRRGTGRWSPPRTRRSRRQAAGPSAAADLAPAAIPPTVVVALRRGRRPAPQRPARPRLRCTHWQDAGAGRPVPPGQRRARPAIGASGSCPCPSPVGPGRRSDDRLRKGARGPLARRRPQRRGPRYRRLCLAGWRGPGTEPTWRALRRPAQTMSWPNSARVPHSVAMAVDNDAATGQGG